MPSLPLKHKRILPHLIGCAIFLCLPMLVSPAFQFSFSIFSEFNIQRDFIVSALLILFFYFNTYFLTDHFLTRKRIPIYFLIIAVCYLLINFAPNVLINPGPPPNFPSPPPGPRLFEEPSATHQVLHHFYLFCVALFLSLSFKSYLRWQQSESEKFKSEILFLKAQINPHFLFNSLNSLYELTLTKSDKAPGAVIALSEMMRYSIENTTSQLVPLLDEIKYINNYIALQRLRLEETVIIDYTVNTSSVQKNIAPLMLIPFIENAFKYGVSNAHPAAISISIEEKDNVLTLFVHNKKFAGHIADSTGVGIANTQRRLELFYPEIHSLTIHDQDNDFSVALKIILS